MGRFRFEEARGQGYRHQLDLGRAVRQRLEHPRGAGLHIECPPNLAGDGRCTVRPDAQLGVYRRREDGGGHLLQHRCDARRVGRDGERRYPISL